MRKKEKKQLGWYGHTVKMHPEELIRRIHKIGIKRKIQKDLATTIEKL